MNSGSNLEKLMVLNCLSDFNQAAINTLKPKSSWDDFCKGRLNSNDNDLWLAYLEHRPELYQQWLSQPTLLQQPSYLQKLWIWYQNTPSIAALVPTAAALLIMFNFAYSALLNNDLNYLIDQDLINLSLTTNKAVNLHLPWEKSQSSLAFSAPSQSSPQSLAFAHGLTDARAHLQGSSNKLELEHPYNFEQQKYYELGRWHILLWSMASRLVQQGDMMWPDQQEVLNLIQQGFIHTHDRQAKWVQKHLYLIDNNLKGIVDHPDSKHHRSMLLRELKHFRALISPTKITKFL